MLSDRLRTDMADIVNDYCHACGKPYGTAREIANGMGISPSTLTRWLSGKNQPSSHLLDVADAYVRAYNEQAMEQRRIRDKLTADAVVADG